MEQIEPTTPPSGIADTDAPRTGKLTIPSSYRLGKATEVP